MPELMPKWARCPECGTVHFTVRDHGNEFSLVCVEGHELRRFFALTQPDVPPPPVRSQHAAAQVARPDR